MKGGCRGLNLLVTIGDTKRLVIQTADVRRNDALGDPQRYRMDEGGWVLMDGVEGMHRVMEGREGV